MICSENISQALRNSVADSSFTNAVRFPPECNEKTPREYNYRDETKLDALEIRHPAGRKNRLTVTH
jgi:hypothetical protein